MRWLVTILFLFLVPAWTALAAQAELEQALMEANQYFDQATGLVASDPEQARNLYQRATLRYERILNAGVRNGKLYYNLGNAYFLRGDIGRAILNYRRAERLTPNDPKLHQNLAYVRDQRLDRIDEPQRKRVLRTVFFWHYDLSSRFRALLFGLCFLGLWSVAAARLFVSRAGLSWAVAILAVLSAAFFSSVSVDAYERAHDRGGVIVAEDVIARKGNGETYQPSFKEPLHSGTEFEFIEERTGWHHIRLHDTRDCWIPEAAAEGV